jgi:mucin-19
LNFDLLTGSLPVKNSSLDSHLQNPNAKRVAIFLLLALAVLLHVNFSYAQTVNVNMNPGGGKVVAGTAVITQSGLQTQVNQASQRAVVNWDSFNVGKDASVTLISPIVRL